MKKRYTQVFSKIRSKAYTKSITEFNSPIESHILRKDTIRNMLVIGGFWGGRYRGNLGRIYRRKMALKNFRINLPADFKIPRTLTPPNPISLPKPQPCSAVLVGPVADRTRRCRPHCSPKSLSPPPAPPPKSRCCIPLPISPDVVPQPGASSCRL
ncbi:hypothetical protein PIB30_014783 [Stylosanthes scabra]|uniref:Uncharacterized protein n=1 Tax=Stylosanthes scabra TaxID=79078 RepID=A0ABU6Z5T0_9FABA|nr:hypothetical protein [Stylosanthes scabra]